ncbi:MAG: TetR/AcrR family transcriptional regulator, partial [bacterium]
ERTRTAILEAAFKEMYEHGFQAASLERILSNTQVTKGALYHHFPNKLALGIAVVEEVISGYVLEKNVRPLEGTDDPIPVLIELFESRLETCGQAEMEYGCPMNNLIQEMSPLDENFRKGLQEIQFTWHRAIANALERGQAAGNVRMDVDADEVAMFIIAAVEGSVGITKSLQSIETLRGCMNQLRHYLETLLP